MNDAMRLIEESNPDLAGVLPRTYASIENSTIAALLRHVNSYTKDLEGDGFGLIYEYFLGKFALAEGQGAGEFFTPMSIVRLIVEVIEPFRSDLRPRVRLRRNVRAVGALRGTAPAITG